jgi:hypothetical protein
MGGGRGGEMRLGDGNFADRLAGGPSGGDARAGGGYIGDPRQFRNQLGQMTSEAGDLRRQLQAGGAGSADLRAIDDVARALREMGSGRLDGDPRGLQQLTASALETLRKLEFDLRKRTDPTSNELYLSGADDAPPQYRPMVSEYLRELSRRSGTQR